MTFGDLLAAVWRRRLLAALGLALTAAAIFLGSSPVEAWNGRVSVVLIVPEGAKGNALAPTTESLIAVTGVVAREVTGPGEEPQTVSADLTLTSLGVEHGWSARQPNAGGQWDVNYEEPRLDVKSAGSTPEEAASQMTKALSTIEQSLTHLQDEKGVEEGQRIRIQLSPAQPVYTRQSGSRMRVMAATGLAGLAATLAVVLGAERLASTAGRSRRRTGDEEVPS